MSRNTRNKRKRLMISKNLKIDSPENPAIKIQSLLDSLASIKNKPEQIKVLNEVKKICYNESRRIEHLIFLVAKGIKFIPSEQLHLISENKGYLDDIFVLCLEQISDLEKIVTKPKK
jgi:hypothetical protein